MQKIIQKYIFAILVGLAVLFIGAIVLFYGWGISYVASGIDQMAQGNPTNNAPPQFNITGAAKINYRGILPQEQGLQQP